MGELSGVFSARRALTPLLQSPPSWPQGPTSCPTPGGIRFQHVNLGGNTHTQPTAPSTVPNAGDLILHTSPRWHTPPGPDPGAGQALAARIVNESPFPSRLGFLTSRGSSDMNSQVYQEDKGTG